jgi:2,3-bisphosphoglycerate-independent phosphoglycerate mutase
MSKKAILVIMDGWGKGTVPTSDAIQQAQVPFTNSLYNNYPNTTLITCGEGAGRIVYQELQRINVNIKNGNFFNNPVINNAIEYAKNNNKALHLLGLVSDGGVHSHTSHLKAITTLCKQKGLTQVYLHAFTDGRDTDPKSGIGFVKDVQKHLQETVGSIATVIGRYFAMDRDKRWERVALAYNALVHGKGDNATNAIEAMEAHYANNITDEFIKPIIITNDNGTPLATIQEGDAVVCFNFRTDRCREITEVLTQTNMPEHGMQTLKLHYTTMTQYDKTYKNVFSVFENDNLNNTIGEVLEAHDKKQIRIAETEKYPHVTFFFSGGREKEFEGEKRILKPSPKVATYDLQPEMSALELTDGIVPEIEDQTADFICLNYANTDMVGHTGVFSAAIKAAETVDKCVERVVTAALKNDYAVFLLADHGNADYMINEDGTPNTAHTLNPVPFFIISNQKAANIKPGKLGDVAPTILNYMNIAIPKEMDGNILATF